LNGQIEISFFYL